MPIEAIRPRYDWLTYNEPEGHLDDLVETLGKLPGIGPASRLAGITYKDASTLERFARRGFGNTRCIPADDFAAPASPFGLETIQSLLSDEATVARLARAYGQSDVVLMRHVVEHSPDARRLVVSLRGLISPTGYLVLEVPDSDRILAAGNHAFVWEEHFSYFTEASLRGLAAAAGARMAWFGRYSYPYEDSLIAVLQFGVGSDASSASKEGTERVRGFSGRFPEARARWRKELEGYRAGGKTVAMFGAGHLSAKFINFLDLADLIDCVVDDHPKKAGMLMPGSRLPIVPSSEMASRGVAICVSTLNPESETRVRQKLATFVDGGGRFVPAFATK